ncbi:MAG: GNAT family N-acetyltransferase [Methyloceanibacter sp.]|uniref:GNAT family N-acetyltransferase n=1 Tax=Methyloceanibacter sp. TaxID=1965321 RepID=UPI003D6D11F3
MTVIDDEALLIFEAPLGSDLYAQALRLRREILREPLGLKVTAEELADDAMRQHFCAVSCGTVVGTVSLRPLDETTLQLKQMAVAEARRRMRIGARLLAHAEGWARAGGFRLMVLHARIGAEGFYFRLGYGAEGERFLEHTIPHIRMTKRLG